MKKRILGIFCSVIAGLLPAPAAYSSENFSVTLRGNPAGASVNIISAGESTNLQAWLKISLEDGTAEAKIAPCIEGPVIKFRNFEAGGSLYAQGQSGMAGSAGAWPASITGEDIFFRMLGEGLAVENGKLSAFIHDSEILIEALKFTNGGTALITGKIGLREEKPSARILFEMERFTLFDRPDRRMTVSGAGELQSKNAKISAKGYLNIDSAEIFASGMDISASPALDEDITVLGEEPADEGFSSPLEEASFRISLGEAFRIRTDELDLRLEGELEIKIINGLPPSVTGVIRTAEGSYRAYGQEMAIRRGIITFTGRPDDPGLDILAIHKHRDIDVGILITGTLSSPVIELYSDPPMPYVETLSILVLGRTFESAGRGDFGLIAAQAAAILAPEEYARLESEILKATGLDQIRLAHEEEMEETIVILGKRISSKLYFTYKRGIAGLTNSATLEYFLSPRWILRTETGFGSLIGIKYSITFD